jgi:hypothetical protein
LTIGNFGKKLLPIHKKIRTMATDSQAQPSAVSQERAGKSTEPSLDKDSEAMDVSEHGDGERNVDPRDVAESDDEDRGRQGDHGRKKERELAIEKQVSEPQGEKVKVDREKVRIDGLFKSLVALID